MTAERNVPAIKGRVKFLCGRFRYLRHNAFSVFVGAQGLHKNSGSHIDASHSRQPLVKGERLVRYEVNAVMPSEGAAAAQKQKSFY